MMFFLILSPGFNGLLNLLNPLSSCILMITSISHFIFPLVNNNETKPLFSSQPRLIFMVKHFDSLYLFKTDVHVDFVKLQLLFIIC